MKRPASMQFRLGQIALAVAGVFGIACSAQTANTDIANEPLAQAASGVKPNLMFILDDSGSMASDFSPDYIPDDQPSGANPSRTAGCYDSGDSGSSSSNDFDDAAGSIAGRPDACMAGDPPYMSPDFNRQYYNPAIYYRPAANSDGTDRTIMNAGNTTNWTAVPTDAFNILNKDQLGNTVSTVNLISGYPDRTWCQTTADDPLGANCRTNSGYTFPDADFPYGLTSVGGSVKYRFGSPYYYRMQTAQWCSSAALTASTCVSGSSVNPATHIFPAGEFCTDSELTNCAVGTALTAAHTFSGARYCSDAGTLLNCQRKKIGNFKFPKHLGTTVASTSPTPVRAAIGSITVTTSVTSRQITSITIGGVAVITGVITATGTNTSTMATQIRTAINALVSTPDYIASGSGSTVTITAATPGTGENGKAVVVTAPSVGTVRASATLTINATAAASSVNITQVTVTGVANIMSSTCVGAFANGVTAAAGTITASTGTNSSAKRQSTAQAVSTCINAATGTNGGYTATFSGGVVTVQAPLADGSGANLKTLFRSGTVPATGGTFSGGQSTAIVTTVNNMAGGTAAGSAGQTVRIGVGLFSRTDIVPATTSYTKNVQRTDCTGTDCTYNEEMTNFANWYAYYRTRIQMMKSAAGRAFIPIDDTYRVGFITINPGDPVSSSKYLKIDTFDSVHKSNWYTKFYARTTGSSTPLREALSRVGRLYAGQFDGINNGIPAADDPVQVSCQPNFAILSTDGYWNGSGGKLIDSTDMTQQDNTNTAPYSRLQDGVYDGGASSTIGLADVALYYYQTDLRPCPGGTPADGICLTSPLASDNVPTTQKDIAPHQHMTTFTLGLGLDGELTYIKNYETAATGAFAQIKAGTLAWPDPVADAPSALDDLWHAAVNGRGVFFSASDPQELANGLSETLDELRKRVGAGAAAATSNLQPVAGDNFAFTAQYQTSDWIGDLKARTIDLSNGTVSTVELWSAQAKLDARTVASRSLFTLDTSDTAGNLLKHFCWPGTPGTNCSDGAGLTGTEQALFNPNLLPQYTGWSPAQKAEATAERLVNYLRGDTSYENTGAVLATDLFRARASKLGDIINAQPTYVKASPFSYTDNGYLAFKKCTDGTGTGCPAAQFPTPTLPRRSTVYAAANDGMLHAFETDVNNNPYFQTQGIGTLPTSDDVFTGNNAGNGEERWAYLPAIILPNLYKLASSPYSHRYFTDGTPLAGDICISNPCAGIADWRTILVAGLNSGGRGYYALDVTNPLAPKALWEFTVRKPSVNACAATEAAAVGASDDCDLGLTYGNPAITKLSTGQWVVIVTSGHNNTGKEAGGTARQGDGKGYLYILDAATGVIVKKIGTGVGDGGTVGANYTDADPSGLARINNWVDNSLQDNTSLAVYGGDLKGNLWRFDLDATKPTYLTAVKVAEVKDGATPQPITVKPELGLVEGNRVIFFGTGKFLGNSDKTDSQRQTLYAIRDDLATDVTVTDRTPLVQQTLTILTGGLTRAGTSNAVDWTSRRGWFIDLPDGGSGSPASPTERVSVDPQLQLGTLVIASNVPSGDSCTAGGYAWINFLNFKTGGFIQGTANAVVSTKISSSLVVGLNIVQLPGGVVKTIVTTADNQQLSQDTPVGPSTFQGRRVGWRELIAD